MKEDKEDVNQEELCIWYILEKQRHYKKMQEAGRLCFYMHIRSAYILITYASSQVQPDR